MKRFMTMALTLTALAISSQASYGGCAKAYAQKANALYPESNNAAIGAMGAGMVGVGYLAMSATFAVGLGPVGIVPEAAAIAAYLDKVDRIRYFGDLIQDAHKFKSSGASTYSQWLPVDSDPMMGEITGQTRLIRLMNHVERKVKGNRIVMPNELLEAIVAADANNEFCPRSEHGKIHLKTSMKEFSEVIVNYL